MCSAVGILAVIAVMSHLQLLQGFLTSALQLSTDQQESVLQTHNSNMTLKYVATVSLNNTPVSLNNTQVDWT